VTASQHRAIALVILGLVALPSAARAGGFEVPDQSPVAGGTGGASTARPDDAAAAWYNPAALADGRGFRGSLSLLLAFPTVNAESLERPPEGPVTATNSDVSTPLALHLSYAHDAWALGAYVGVSHGSSVRWPDDWWGRYEALSSTVRVLRVAPFFAYRFRELANLTFSVGVHVDVGSLEIQRALNMIDFQGSSHVLMGGAGVGGDASVFVTPIEQLSLGFTYKSRTYVRMDGDADFTVPDAFTARASDQRAATDFWIPDRFALGAGLHLDALHVYADLGLSLWSVRDRILIEFANEGTADVEQAQQWRDAVDVRAGAEYRVIPEVTVRGGIRYEMAAAPAHTLAPSSPDVDRFGVALGASIDPLPELGFDVHYGYTALLPGVSTSEDAPPARYSGDAHFVGIAVRARFDPSPPRRRARPTPTTPSRSARRKLLR
jgi:long-chain fatty acid transport protein